MSRVAVGTDLLRWALERSGNTPASLKQRLPGIQGWLSGEQQPTLRQLESLARATHTPLGFLFLDEPPEERLPIPHFRTLGDEAVGRRPSPNLLDSVQAMRRRQLWMREFLVEQGQEPLAFVGSAQATEQARAIAQRLRRALGLGESWASSWPTWTDAFRALREAAEAAGIFVVVNGVVGNDTHRKLDPAEFRGFVLADDYAPLVFVNGADGKAAQMFTLAHELAHVILGSSAAFDLRQMQPADNQTEKACNRVAAELLVPEGELCRLWDTFRVEAEPFQAVARHFRVSVLVAARRALDLGLIDRDRFLEFYRDYQQDERRAATRPAQGGNFYANQNQRVGRRFASYVVQAVREERLLYSEAYQLTGLRGKTFDRYVSEVVGGVR